MAVQHRSVSQVKEYADCPYRYYLHRVARVWQRPAAWLAQGLAVHEAAEFWELSNRQAPEDDVATAYRQSYEKHVNRLSEETPNFGYWFPSGRYAGSEDIERRFGLGAEQVRRYVEYYREHADERIWRTPEGRPAVEIAFEIDLDGVRVKGFIDGVVKHPTRGIVVRDIKSGRLPGDGFQLGTYAEALRATYGVRVDSGDYWMGRQGKPTVPYPLKPWSRQRLVDTYGAMDEAVRAQRFDPDPGEACQMCPVAFACTFAAI
ncbi:RecB family exonuclease [Actinocrispum wychmicini]|uniref:Putative RecB family exonuclease n=1 Tax=Actinocrispum wychmicini TaxID=1213861 RepID=A0A4R2JCY8_9PSEU|nr:PD-(D/E)XK nuclease family protein [Actinocrispum wychmicini]TCO56774.1 putative RecB family exonuclease [Actinocrispum wychmicini]